MLTEELGFPRNPSCRIFILDSRLHVSTTPGSQVKGGGESWFVEPLPMATTELRKLKHEKSDGTTPIARRFSPEIS